MCRRSRDLTRPHIPDRDPLISCSRPPCLMTSLPPLRSFQKSTEVMSLTKCQIQSSDTLTSVRFNRSEWRYNRDSRCTALCYRVRASGAYIASCCRKRQISQLKSGQAAHMLKAAELLGLDCAALHLWSDEYLIGKMGDRLIPVAATPNG